MVFTTINAHVCQSMHTIVMVGRLTGLKDFDWSASFVQSQVNGTYHTKRPHKHTKEIKFASLTPTYKSLLWLKAWLDACCRYCTLSIVEWVFSIICRSTDCSGRLQSFITSPLMQRTLTLWYPRGGSFSIPIGAGVWYYPKHSKAWGNFAPLTLLLGWQGASSLGYHLGMFEMSLPILPISHI